MYCWEKTAQA